MKRVKSVVVLLIVMVLVLQLGLHMAAAKDVVTMNIGSDQGVWIQPWPVQPTSMYWSTSYLRVSPGKGLRVHCTGVAREWSFDQDTNTYTFVLRDAQFSNGDPITAEDLCIPGRGPWILVELIRICLPASYYIKGAQALNEIDLRANA